MLVRSKTWQIRATYPGDRVPTKASPPYELSGQFAIMVQIHNCLRNIGRIGGIEQQSSIFKLLFGTSDAGQRPLGNRAKTASGGILLGPKNSDRSMRRRRRSTWLGRVCARSSTLSPPPLA